MWEGKCTNEECPANEVWVLIEEDEIACPTCNHPFFQTQEAPPQKQADPNKKPDPDKLNMGG